MCKYIGLAPCSPLLDAPYSCWLPLSGLDPETAQAPPQDITVAILYLIRLAVHVCFSEASVWTQDIPLSSSVAQLGPDSSAYFHPAVHSLFLWSNLVLESHSFIAVHKDGLLLRNSIVFDGMILILPSSYQNNYCDRTVIPHSWTLTTHTLQQVLLSPLIIITCTIPLHPWLVYVFACFCYWFSLKMFLKQFQYI